MKLSINDFGGMAPKIEPRRLGDGFASYARNASFESGVLAPANIGTVESEEFPAHDPNVISVLRPVGTTTRLMFTGVTTGEAFGSLVSPTDKWGRAYFSTPGGPRFTVSDNYNVGGVTVDPVSYPLGVKIPEFQPTVGLPHVADIASYELALEAYKTGKRTYELSVMAYNASQKKNHTFVPPPPGASPAAPTPPTQVAAVVAYYSQKAIYDAALQAYNDAKALDPLAAVQQPIAPAIPASVVAYNEAMVVYQDALARHNEATSNYSADLATFHAEKAAYDEAFTTYEADLAAYRVAIKAYNRDFAALEKAFKAANKKYAKDLAAYLKAEALDPNTTVPKPVAPVPVLPPTPPASPGTPTAPVPPIEPAPVTGDMLKVRYIFTFVDKYGHEGAPSLASTVVEVPYELGFSVKLSFVAEDVGDMNVDGAVRRIYRATFDGSSSEWQFIADVPVAMGEWHDTIPLGTESEVLISTNWAPPPRLVQMVPVASAYIAGFHDNVVCYSEARLPHAWPEEYRFPLKHQIVGLKSTKNGMLIATTGKPYWAFGADPASAVPVELSANHPCLGEKSLVDMGDYVVYATHDGLVAVDGQDVTLLTEDYIDRLTWLRDFDPEAIVAFAHEGRYVFSVGTEWWVFVPEGGFSTLSGVSVNPTQLQQAYYDAPRDTTVLVGAGGICFDVISTEGTDCEYKSRIFRTPAMSFGVARLLATEYPCTLTVEADGVERIYAVADGLPFRLHGGFRANEWVIGIEAPGRVLEAAICQSPGEL